jgi:hypothetical protein
MIASFISLDPESSILIIGITPDDLPNVTGEVAPPVIDIVEACEFLGSPLPDKVQILFGRSESEINATIALAFKETVEMHGGSMDETESNLVEVNVETGEKTVTDNVRAIEADAANLIKARQTQGGKLN